MNFWPLIVIGLIVFFGIVIWSIKRHRDPKLDVHCDLPIDQLLPSFAGLTLGSPIPGNAVEVIENGAFFDVLLDEIRQARHTIHFETFLWKDGALATRVADAFCARAREGVKVRILLDANGSRRMSAETQQRLEAAGCRVVKFHQFKLQNIGVLAERDHRKICVADGRVALVGGHCITDNWLGDAHDSEHYADVSVRVRGPVVNAIQAAFSENWAGQTGELFMGEEVFPAADPAGDVAMLVAFAKPEGSAPAVKILHHGAICVAKRRIWIQNPYFIPEPEAIDAMAEAVARGVDIRVLMPSTSGSDNPMVQHAGHYTFERLLKAGVRLYEYPHTLLHQKVMTVDGSFCLVGSANFDDRSFETNDEITLGICDAATTAMLDRIFEKHAARAQEMSLSRWRRRGLWHRLTDGFFYLANEVL